jgi:transcriptional regulator with XRE-family HTH domain
VRIVGSRKAHIHNSQDVWETLGMNPDSAVGQRLADLRKQKELRQEDFLALLEARGVGWTQTTLSRVEGGKRALKATELFAVADALGVEPSQLNPAAGGLFYEIQSHRLKHREATAAARHAVDLARDLRARLIALILTNEIQSGRTEFVVHGSARQFIDIISQALSPVADAWNPRSGEQAVGIDGKEVQEEFESLTSAEFPDSALEDIEDDDHSRLFDAAYRRVFARRLPLLKFTSEDGRHGDDGDFAVEGINVDDESDPVGDFVRSLLSDMLYGRDPDGG